MHAQRKRQDLYNGGLPTTRSGDKSYHFFNPKLGLLWDAGPQWQIYSNISRSAEPPTFNDMTFSTSDDLDRLQAQRATTFEIGTRGESGDVAWDVSLYHARVKMSCNASARPGTFATRPSTRIAPLTRV